MSFEPREIHDKSRRRAVPERAVSRTSRSSRAVRLLGTSRAREGAGPSPLLPALVPCSATCSCARTLHERANTVQVAANALALAFGATQGSQNRARHGAMWQGRVTAKARQDGP